MCVPDDDVGGHHVYRSDGPQAVGDQVVHEERVLSRELQAIKAHAHPLSLKHQQS